MIRTVPLTQFTEMVREKVPRNTPDANIENAVSEAINYFMSRSRAAVDEMYIDVDCSEIEISLDMPDCRRLIQIEHVFLDEGCKRARWTPEWEELMHTERGGMGWWSDDVGGPNETIWVLPRGNRHNRYCVRYSWKLGRDKSCQVPEWLYEDHRMGIEASAIAWLHNQPIDKDAQASFARLMDQVMASDIAYARRRKEAQYRNRAVKMTTQHFFGG
jgi:hypothetical protein